jgi:hypothetical protein
VRIEVDELATEGASSFDEEGPVHAAEVGNGPRNFRELADFEFAKAWFPAQGEAILESVSHGC